MQFRHKIVSSQLKFVNDFIHFKLIISNIVKIVAYYLMEFFIFNKPWGFFTAIITVSYKHYPICLVFLTLELSFALFFLQLTQ